jgi:putative endonuclease
MLRCTDCSYYVGKTQRTLEERIGEHNFGTFKSCYTYKRRPVELVWHQEFQQFTDAAERRIKGWSRAKKEALIRGDWEAIRQLAKRRV